MKKVIIIGGGPAGLMAAQVLSGKDVLVEVVDAMPTVGRKFLLAGVGGLNLTHSEPFDDFLSRYGAQQRFIAPCMEAFPPQALRQWAHDLGIDTFVGSSGRVFPREMKAAPLLRAWLHRLRAAGVRFRLRSRWLGWDEKGDVRLVCHGEETTVQADALVLALGGGSWSRLGSDAAWVPLLAARGIPVTSLLPANCGFEVEGGWSAHLRERFAGQPLKTVALGFKDSQGGWQQRRGELIVTDWGVEGGVVYSLSSALRDTLAQQGSVDLMLDLLPDKSLDKVVVDLSRPRGKQSLATYLQRRVGIKGVKMGLLRECAAPDQLHDPASLAQVLKALTLRLSSPRPLEEAISTAGGVYLTALDEHLMLHALPGVFCAGEMLDWEAPTGGYLLSACMASGYVAGQGVQAFLAR